MPVGSTTSKWTMSSYIHYWLGSLQSTCVNLCCCVYQSVSRFNLDCWLYPCWFCDEDPWVRSAHFRLLIVAMTKFSSYALVAIFSCQWRFLLWQSLTNIIWYVEPYWYFTAYYLEEYLSLCWQLVMWLLCGFMSFSMPIKPYQWCVYSGLFHLCFAEMLTKYYMPFYIENDHVWF